MGLRDTLRKAAGLLVELPPEEQPAAPSAADSFLADLEGRTAPARTVEEIVRESEGPNLDQIAVNPAAAPPTSPDGAPDFAAVYRDAGLATAPFSAEQMLEMLASLPNELPLDTKRQTVRVSLGALGKSVGATPESIVADASRKVAALAAYVEALSHQTTGFVQQAETEIAALQAEIEEKRKAIQDAKVKLTRATQACETESDRLDDVLEFFSLDVHPSKYAERSGGARPG